MQTPDEASSIPDPSFAPPQIPGTYDELKAARAQYALIGLGILVLSWCLTGAGQIISLQMGGSQEGSQASPGLFWTLGIIPGLLAVIITAIYSKRVGMPTRISLISAFLALWPIGMWIAFFMVVGYTPQHLREFEPVEKPAAPTWLIVGLMPLALLALLSMLNARYVGQLFLGPPIGANLLGFPIPCGWPVFGLILLSLAPSNLSLWLGFQKGFVRGRWKMLLVALVFIHFTLPSFWLVLMGPAAVQVCSQFLSDICTKY